MHKWPKNNLLFVVLCSIILAGTTLHFYAGREHQKAIIKSAQVGQSLKNSLILPQKAEIQFGSLTQIITVSGHYIQPNKSLFSIFIERKWLQKLKQVIQISSYTVLAMNIFVILFPSHFFT